MSRMLDLGSISTRQGRIAELAEKNPQMSFTSLNQHLDEAWLKEAHRLTRKDGAVGVDGQTAKSYGRALEENLCELLERAKSGRYRAPAVRRVHIPKGSGSQTRPIGIPTFEDKVLQRAVVMLLEPIFEHDFEDLSYGFRPGRSAQDALDVVRKALMEMGGGWVLDADIQGFFSSLPHVVVRETVKQRVRDGVVLRLIGKWLKAGVSEEGATSYPKEGTPQGGVISPLLSNIVLHEVLDSWWTAQVSPRLTGRAVLVRYADDFAVVFENKADAERVLRVLPKRLAKYGLTLHPEKTRLVDMTHPWKGDGKPETFDFLGFTHFWGKTRRGGFAIKQKTSRKRFARSLKAIGQWCRNNRHDPMWKQHRELSRKLRGHYAYFGRRGNRRALDRFLREVQRHWVYWLRRRSQRTRVTWNWVNEWLAKKLPLPQPKMRPIRRPAANL